MAVPKKNREWRFCADYRRLNSVTRRDCRPVANLNKKLAHIRGDPTKPIEFYCLADLSEAYKVKRLEFNRWPITGPYLVHFES